MISESKHKTRYEIKSGDFGASSNPSKRIPLKINATIPAIITPKLALIKCFRKADK
jgi:hypothetical protein